MIEYIERNSLYKEIAELEELARDRVLDTPINSPAYRTYLAQLNERTMLKHKICDTPKADVAPVAHGKWVWKQGICEDEFYLLCSCCKMPAISRQDEENGMESYIACKFCPQCGASMDLEAQP